MICTLHLKFVVYGEEKSSLRKNFHDRKKCLNNTSKYIILVARDLNSTEIIFLLIEILDYLKLKSIQLVAMNRKHGIFLRSIFPHFFFFVFVSPEKLTGLEMYQSVAIDTAVEVG